MKHTRKEDFNWFLDGIYYPVYRFIRWEVLQIPWKMKLAYQRVRKGYDMTATWSIDYWFTELVPKMIRELAENTHGVPSEFSPDDSSPHEDALEKWQTKLREIADDLEAWKNITDLDYSFNAEWKTLHDKRNLRWRFEKIPNREDVSEMKFESDLTEAEDARFWELQKQLEAESYERWKRGMAEFTKYFGNLWD
jgi:hypothetical protein